ncbi:WxL domain-containing protein [Enterococcus faecium]|uniref:WxL domain-containing protein n=1 Tax=Enterococcus faecium TaxID=1352 RepID=UPI0002A1B21D|nr:WxL domain-containing protein [Enterococcus faecium]ELA94244.1 hypothetical protein OIA_05099 [Enterococcus faecium EnGen0018]
MKAIRLLGATLLASTTLLGAGQAFAASEDSVATPSSARTNLSVEITPADDLPEITPPGGDGSEDNDGDGQPDGGNKPNPGVGLFGIAYQPYEFNFQAVNSKSTSFSTTAPAPEGKTWNVGVKDKTNDTKGWELKASLHGNVVDNAHATLSFTNSTGVKENNGSGTLGELNVPGTVTAESSVSIDGSTQKPVMTGVNDQLKNAYAYDYQMDDVTLTFGANTPANQYSGYINWNLSVAPGA